MRSVVRILVTMPIELPGVESFAVRAGHASGELLCMFELMSSEEWLVRESMESICDNTSSGDQLLHCSWFEVPSLAVPFHNGILFM